MLEKIRLSLSIFSTSGWSATRRAGNIPIAGSTPYKALKGEQRNEE
jgi:hypothetical protein